MNAAEKKMQKRMRIAAIMLTGAIISMALSAMLLTHSCNPKTFYDAGSVLEDQIVYVSGCVYDYTTGRVEATVEGACQYWIFSKTLKPYNYFMIEIAGLEPEGLPVVFLFYKNGIQTDALNVNLKNGENVIEITQREDDTLYMALSPGDSYEFYGIECREKLSMWDAKKFVLFSIIAFFCYLVLFFLLHRRIYKNVCMPVYRGFEKLQEIYRKILEKWASEERFAANKKRVRFLRKLLFFLMLCLINYMEKKGLYGNEIILAWRIDAWVYSVILILLGFLSIEKQYRKLNWKNPLVSAWFLFSLCMIISNFIVVKSLKNIGFLFLLAFGFLYYVWGNMADKTELLQDFCVAVKLEFWLDICYCFLFCPEIPGFRYAGDFLNCNVFALYAVVPWIVFFADLWEKGNENLKGKIFSAVGLGIATYLIRKTGCRTAILGILLAAGIGLLICKREKIFKRKKGKRLYFCLLLFVILGGVVGQVGVTKLPKIPKEPQTEEGIVDEARLQETEVFENRSSIFVLKAEAANNRLMDTLFHSKSLYDFTSGRTIFWKAYLRQINLWGHSYRAEVNGKIQPAHNAFLGVAYEYGALTAVVYPFWVLYYIWYAFRYLKRERAKSRYAVLPFFLIISLIPAIFFENLEQRPFRWEAWIAMYLLAGLLFEQEPETD